jgi:acyl carrier protein
MSEFYEGMAEILEIDPQDVTPDLDLTEENWDSLAVVSTIALIDDVYDVMVSPERLADCKTVGEIEALVASEKQE